MATEKRLIDANALKEKAEPEEVTGEGIVYVQDIDEAPTVDAVVVVHGQYEKSIMKDEWYGHIYTCKECKYQCMVDDGTGNDVAPNYCPNCGARYMEVSTNEKDYIRAH